MCFSLKEEREEGKGESISPLGAEQGTLRDCFGLRWTKKIAASVGGPHKTLSTTGKTENTERQGREKKRRQTFSTFCLDFSWIREDGIGGLQRAGWIETSQRAKNARKGA